MDRNLIARASVLINAGRTKVWEALINPEAIRQYMFGTTVLTDWKTGHPIFWQGEWEEKEYEDKGIVLQVNPERLLQFSHFSPLSGVPDKPENYHIVTIELTGDGNQTRVSLSQDNNSTDTEREHSEKNWEMMLSALKKFVEQ